jgi:hypothetical protein
MSVSCSCGVLFYLVLFVGSTLYYFLFLVLVSTFAKVAVQEREKKRNTENKIYKKIRLLNALVNTEYCLIK